MSRQRSTKPIDKILSRQERIAVLKEATGRTRAKGRSVSQGSTVDEAADPGPSSVEHLRDRWREAVVAADAATDDSTASRLVIALNDAEEALVDAPVASVRDLACKVEVLRRAGLYHNLDGGWPANIVSMICRGVEDLADAEEARTAQEEAAAQIDLAGCRTNELCRLYEVLSQSAEQLSTALCMPCFELRGFEGDGFSRQSLGGLLIDAERSRLAHLRDACARELDRRVPDDRFDRDDALSIRIVHELACNGRIAEPGLLLEAIKAWG